MVAFARCFVLLPALVLVCPLFGEEKKFKPIDDKTLAAWQKKGARAGGYYTAKNGATSFHLSKKISAKELPGFRFDWTVNRSLKGVPVVVVHFGLELHKIRDEELKHLADQRNLLRLAMMESSVTDEGLKHLTGMKDLQRLSFPSC